jgi:hypothetical protein
MVLTKAMNAIAFTGRHTNARMNNRTALDLFSILTNQACSFPVQRQSRHVLLLSSKVLNRLVVDARTQ